MGVSNSVTVLAYHRIALPGNPDLAPSLIDAYPTDFDAQMRLLAARHNVVSSWDLVRALRDGSTLPERAVIITFDDAYRCFADTALPVLRRLGLPVTLFVTTHISGNPHALFWWDTLYRALMRTGQGEIEVLGLGALPLTIPVQRNAAYGKLVPFIERKGAVDAARLLDSILEHCAVEPNRQSYLLGWEELAALSAEGVAIGPHSRHHPILAQVPRERLRAEVMGSWADVRARVPNPLPIFCYPNGKPHAVNRAAANAVRAAGLAGAYTMVAGLNRLGRTNPYLMYRVGMVAGQSLRRFAFKIGAGGHVYRRLKGLAGRGAERFG